MENLLIRKLEHFAPLSLDDVHLLDEVIVPSRSVPARSELMREGQSSSDVWLILEGFACLYKLLPSGGRQIVGYLLPGDFSDIGGCILKVADHGIGTLSLCTVVEIPCRRILELRSHPGIARAFGWAALVDGATQREWLLNIGQRHAARRVGHLLCELFTRLQAVGLADGSGCDLPLTRADIGDTVGLSNVHVYRCLQTLRDMKLVAIGSRSVAIRDVVGLMDYTDFNPNYLHLNEHRPSAHYMSKAIARQVGDHRL